MQRSTSAYMANAALPCAQPMRALRQQLQLEAGMLVEAQWFEPQHAGYPSTYPALVLLADTSTLRVSSNAQVADEQRH